MDVLWITCNPDNWPSRKTSEWIGATLVEIVDLPPENDQYKRRGKTEVSLQMDPLLRGLAGLLEAGTFLSCLPLILARPALLSLSPDAQNRPREICPEGTFESSPVRSAGKMVRKTRPSREGR